MSLYLTHPLVMLNDILFWSRTPWQVVLKWPVSLHPSSLTACRHKRDTRCSALWQSPFSPINLHSVGIERGFESGKTISVTRQVCHKADMIQQASGRILLSFILPLYILSLFSLALTDSTDKKMKYSRICYNRIYLWKRYLSKWHVKYKYFRLSDWKEWDSFVLFIPVWMLYLSYFCLCNRSLHRY